MPSRGLSLSTKLTTRKENSGRAKEMYTHSQQRWEKEIRRSRKETFKVQSTLVKAQEELKSARTAQKATEEELQTERERSKAREQEAFDAQYRLVGLQEQLDQALARAKMLEQELESLRALTKSETEVKRSVSTEDGDDSQGPRKRARLSTSAFGHGDPEIETITMLWEWEKQRAERALEQVDFLEAECQLKMCSAGKELRRTSVQRSGPRKRTSMLISDAGDSMILSESRRASAEMPKPAPKLSKTDQLREKKEPRRSTIFLPAEGIFRTVSQAEADEIAAKSTTSSGVSPTEAAPSLPITPMDNNPLYRRSPSLDPPDFAILGKQRTSLLSLLDAPHRQEPAQVFNIPTTPGPAALGVDHADAEYEADARLTTKAPGELILPPRQPAGSLTGPLSEPLPTHSNTATTTTLDAHTRPHTTTSYYRPSTSTTSSVTTTTTTKVPLREEPDEESGPTLAQRLMKMQRTPSRQTGDNYRGSGSESNPDGPSFDTSNPALTPTMTREEALAQIRERRGRARSVGRVGSAGSSAAGGGGSAGSGAAGGRSGSGSGSGSSAAGSSQSGAGEVRRKVSGSSATAGDVRRKVSGGGPPGTEVRRKASGDLSGTMRRAAGGDERGRERDVRREPRPPSAAASARGASGGVRRIRS